MNKLSKVLNNIGLIATLLGVDILLVDTIPQLFHDSNNFEKMDWFIIGVISVIAFGIILYVVDFSKLLESISIRNGEVLVRRTLSVCLIIFVLILYVLFRQRLSFVVFASCILFVDIILFFLLPSFIEKNAYHHFSEPIRNSVDDILNYNKISEQLMTIIAQSNGTYSLRIGLFGEWGTGKSSILNLLSEKLEEKNNYIAIKYNPWQYQNEERALNGLIDSIDNGIKFSRGAILRRKKGLFNSITRLIMNILNFFKPDYANLLQGVVETKDDYEAMKRNVEVYVKERLSTEYRIIVIVDDLDRCEDAFQLEFLRVIREVFNFDFLDYVVGLSNSRVDSLMQQSLVEIKHTDKIFNHTIRIPELSLENKTKFASYLSEKMNFKLTKYFLEQLTRLLPSNLRAMQKLFVKVSDVVAMSDFDSDDDTEYATFIMGRFVQEKNRELYGLLYSNYSEIQDEFLQIKGGYGTTQQAESSRESIANLLNERIDGIYNEKTKTDAFRVVDFFISLGLEYSNPASIKMTFFFDYLKFSILAGIDFDKLSETKESIIEFIKSHSAHVNGAFLIRCFDVQNALFGSAVDLDFIPEVKDGIKHAVNYAIKVNDVLREYPDFIVDSDDYLSLIKSQSSFIYYGDDFYSEYVDICKKNIDELIKGGIQRGWSWEIFNSINATFNTHKEVHQFYEGYAQDVREYLYEEVIEKFYIKDGIDELLEMYRYSPLKHNVFSAKDDDFNKVFMNAIKLMKENTSNRILMKNLVSYYRFIFYFATKDEECKRAFRRRFIIQYQELWVILNRVGINKRIIGTLNGYIREIYSTSEFRQVADVFEPLTYVEGEG